MEEIKRFPQLLAILSQIGFSDDQAPIEALLAKMEASDMLTFEHDTMDIKGHGVVATFNDGECLALEKVPFVLSKIEDNLTPILSYAYQYSINGETETVDATENVFYDEHSSDTYILERVEDKAIHFQIWRIPNTSISDAEVFAREMMDNCKENVKNRVIYYDHVTANMPKAKPASPSLLP